MGENPTTGRPFSPKVDTLAKLAKALKVPYETLDKLARGKGSEPVTTTNELSLEDGKQVVISDIQRLPIVQQDKDILSQIVEVYLSRYRGLER
jgi:transcriptional regulator with XRE-family HTH domain